MSPPADGHTRNSVILAPETAPALGPEATFFGPWRREAEKLALVVAQAKSGVVGLTSPEVDSGVSTLARLLTIALSGMDRKTVLLDLSQPLSDEHAPLPGEWRPGRVDPFEAIRREGLVADYLRPSPDRATRALFSNPDTLRGDLRKLLTRYDVVLVDLPNVLDGDGGRVNAIAAALACDQVFLTLATGRTGRENARRAADDLLGAGVSLSGLVMNDVDYVTPGEDIARVAERSRWLPEAWARWIAATARKSALLR